MNSTKVPARYFAGSLDRSWDSTRNLLVLAFIAFLFYTFRLGSWSLGSSEAYSALAASQSTLTGVIHQALRFDPGKPPLYQVLLHYFVGLFGSDETCLRTFSAIFALAALLPLYLLGLSMFSAETALAAVAIWAMNPIALILGRWARMYTLFIAAALMSMLTFWRLRERPTEQRIRAFAVSTALVLYTHLCGLLFVGTEAAVLTRDLYRGRRTRSGWIGLMIALVLFSPFLPREVIQTRALLLGHWLDWIGPAHFGWSVDKTITTLAAGVVMLALVFGPQFESDELEPIRFCASWLIIPILTISAVSIIARPVFALRYAAPAIPALALLIARALEAFGGRARNLSTTCITTAFAVLFIFCRAARYEPWRDIARQVASAGAAQAVFFESPLELNKIQGRAEADEQSAVDFPQGYFRVPFDYYFKGVNPRRVINPFDPVRARHAIASAALGAGAAWLVSGSSDAIAKAEMPQAMRFRITRVLHADHTSLYHVVAVPPQELRNPDRANSDSSRTALTAR